MQRAALRCAESSLGVREGHARPPRAERNQRYPGSNAEPALGEAELERALAERRSDPRADASAEVDAWLVRVQPSASAQTAAHAREQAARFAAALATDPRTDGRAFGMTVVRLVALEHGAAAEPALVRVEVRKRLLAQRRDEARRRLLAELRSEAEVAILIELD